MKPTRSENEKRSLAKCVIFGIADWHYRHFGNIAWDKGEVFIPTLVVTAVVTSPLWLGATCIDCVRFGRWPWSEM